MPEARRCEVCNAIHSNGGKLCPRCLPTAIEVRQEKEIAALRAQLEAANGEVERLEGNEDVLVKEIEKAWKWSALWKKKAKNWRYFSHQADDIIESMCEDMNQSRKFARLWKAAAKRWKSNWHANNESWKYECEQNEKRFKTQLEASEREREAFRCCGNCQHWLMLGGTNCYSFGCEHGLFDMTNSEACEHRKQSRNNQRFYCERWTRMN
jgi:hypothetical protein